MKVLDLNKSYNFDIIFLMQQVLVRDYYDPKTYIIFRCILTISNIKTQNYKVVDIIESHNFDAKSIFI
jgi:hypothetical protein